MKIEFRDVSFSYNKLEAVRNLSLTFEEGKMIAIIGHNGSGKSTIAKLIMGLIYPKSGSIYINDVLMNEENIDEFRSKMGIIFQNPDNQFVGVTVKDDIAFGLENHQVPRNEMIERINKYAKLVGMDAYLDHNPENLSGGQKQRVAIAGSLAMETEVIIFDEATSMLDPKGTKEINQTIYNLKKDSKKTIISITHNLEEVVYADRVVVLSDGKVILDDTPQVVLSQKEIMEANGLKVIDSIKLINMLDDNQEIKDALWELTFKM